MLPRGEKILKIFEKLSPTSPESNIARNYILDNFPVETEGYDIIKGYRADDSYFSYARDFLQNGISVRRLAQVMKLGNLGNQIVLVSKNSSKK